MTLPAGLASIASTWDDTPQVRGAVAMAKWIASPFPKGPMYVGVDLALPGSDRTVEMAIDNHAWLAIRGAYRSRDTRNGTR